MKIQEKLKEKTAVLKSANWFTTLIVVVAMVLGVLYIWQVNIAATRGFTMRDLDQEIAKLSQENERLQVQITKLQSVDSVATRMQMLGLRDIGSIEYVDSEGGSVAIAR
jgi:cell division protein FtsL